MATDLLKRIARIPVLGRTLLMGFRLRSGMSYARMPVRHFAAWLFTSREYTNYTYSLSETNRRYLAAFVAQVTPASYAEAGIGVAFKRPDLASPSERARA